MGKIVGLGVFIKSQDPKILRDWYFDILEIEIHPEYFYASFEPKRMAEINNSAQVFSLMSANSEYFEPSKSGFMLNFCVDDLEYFIEKLKTHNIQILWQDLENDHGKFAHILDPEGNKIELWQPR